MFKARLKLLIPVLALVALIALSVMMPAASLAATTDTECVRVQVTGVSSSDPRTQFKINRSFSAGDKVVLYFKPQDPSSRLRLRGDDSSTTFLQAYFGKDADSVSLGDGWYAVRFTVAKYDGEGTPDETYYTSCVYVTIDKYSAAIGDVVYLRGMTVNGTAVSNSTLLSYYKKSSDHPSTAGAVSIAVDNDALTYEWPVPTIEGFYTKEYFGSGALPTYDTSMYTWTVNTDKGGATNLPAVNLAATGRYQDVTNLNDDLIAALTTTTFVDANNMIFFISDGFGVNDTIMTEFFAGNVIMNDMPYIGKSATNSYGKGTSMSWITTDSAAGGTALSTGFKTHYGSEALDVNGDPIPQITELLREQKGKIIGVATTGWAYDATPAVYGGAHTYRGDDYNQTIATQMMTFAPDLFIGQGVKDYTSIYNSLKGTVLAGQNIGWFTDWSKISGGYDKVWINLTADVRYSDSFKTTHPTISQMMAYSLTWLQAKSHASSDAGFFLMFENGMTDDAGHNNSFVQKIGETRASSEAMAVALKFACENPDTIVIHTADHETGGLVLKQGWQEDPSLIKFTTSGHSSQNVDVFAIGKNTDVFDGVTMYNCQVGKVAAYLMGITMGSTDPEYSIDGIMAGHAVEIDDPTEEKDSFEDKYLQIYAVKAATEISWSFPDRSLAAHANCTFDVKVPDGAQSLSVIGVSADGAETEIRSYTLDGVVNYVSAYNYYAMHFKPDAGFDFVKFAVSGAFAEGDAVFMDNFVVDTDSQQFEDFDMMSLSVPADQIARVSDTAGTPGGEISEADSWAVFRATASNSNPWIQPVISLPIPANGTLSFRFKPVGTLSELSVRDSTASTKFVTFKASSSGYAATVNSGSDVSAAGVTYDAATGWYTATITFKTAQSSGVFIRFVVGAYNAADPDAAAVAIDAWTVGTEVCSFNESNLVSSAANNASLRTNAGTAFTVKQLYQYPWMMTIEANAPAEIPLGIDDIFADYSSEGAISVGEDILFNVFLRTASYDLSGARVRFTIDGKTGEISGAEAAGDGFYRFSYHGVTPQCLGDDILVELIVDDAIRSTTLSVISYLDRLTAMTAAELGITDEQYAAMRTFIDKLKLYSGAAQVYMSYKTDSLNSEGVEPNELEKLTTTDKSNFFLDGSVAFRSVFLRLDFNNRLFFRFAAPGLDDSTVVTLRAGDGDEVVIGRGDIEYDEETGLYTIVSDGILAYDYDVVYTAAIYVDGEEAARVTYSVNSYIYDKQDAYGSKLRNLVRALYSYGKAARALKDLLP